MMSTFYAYKMITYWKNLTCTNTTENKFVKNILEGIIFLQKTEYATYVILTKLEMNSITYLNAMTH